MPESVGDEEGFLSRTKDSKDAGDDCKFPTPSVEDECEAGECDGESREKRDGGKVEDREIIYEQCADENEKVSDRGEAFVVWKWNIMHNSYNCIVVCL